MALLLKGFELLFGFVIVVLGLSEVVCLHVGVDEVVLLVCIGGGFHMLGLLLGRDSPECWIRGNFRLVIKITGII